MIPSATYSRALFGLQTPRVTVETHLPPGLPAFTLVGLPETAVREARDRVKSAIQNCGFEFPAGRVVVNLAPADLVKEGARYDLAIAVSILCATGHLAATTVRRYEFLGELSLFGAIRPVRGALCAALAVAQHNTTQRNDRPPGSADPVRLVIPHQNAGEVAAFAAAPVIRLRHLRDVCTLIQGAGTQTPSTAPLREAPAPAAEIPGPAGRRDSSPVPIVGQPTAKRALEVAAAGRHHLLMVGPPGTGKTLLAQRLRDLLPDLDEARAMEVAAIYSAVGKPRSRWRQPPFRSPHHSVSAPAMAGGGSVPHPGEISLAHHGVLFLDELPHFKPSVLDQLREPLEARVIHVSRTAFSATFPAAFQLVAAMNPCPAGLVCEPARCRCAAAQVRNYQSRISGPLLDRIDIQVAVPQVPGELLMPPGAHTPTQAGASERVAAEQEVMLARTRIAQARTVKGDSSPEQLRDALTADARALLSRAISELKLSARGYHKTLRVARTVAALAKRERIEPGDVAEALSYRALRWDGQWP